ncbi:hypothetical protein G6F22_017122 [Rhizopus arrhizus]|nr:hypothetical protein G6F22_017122 [Rhizopus arrhizus]
METYLPSAQLAVVGAGQQGGAVTDGRVHHLAPASASGFKQAAKNAEGQHHGAAAHVADQVQRRRGRQFGMSHGVQGAGDGDVVQIMAGRLRQRTVLPPAGHASVHQPRIARQAFVGPQAQPFHDARPEPFEQGVGLVQQPQYDIGRAGLLEVQRDRAAASVDDGAAAAQESGRPAMSIVTP